MKEGISVISVKTLLVIFQQRQEHLEIESLETAGKFFGLNI